MSERGFMPKKQLSTNPLEAMLDDIPFDRLAAFKRDQHKVALLAAETIDDREELCDLLEMIGLEVKR